MEKRKVYWSKQGVIEYWKHDVNFGWVKVNKSDGAEWSRDSFDYHELIASDEDYNNRADGGYIRW